MNRRLSSFARELRVALLLPLLACAASHERPGTREPSPTPGPIDGGFAVDAAPLPVDAGPDACTRALAGEAHVACDEATFEHCSRPVAGVPCCSTLFECEAGEVVARAGFCTDECANGCSMILDAVDCSASGCEWFVGGCGPAPVGFVDGPRCMQRRGDTCMTDADCDVSLGERCRSFWIDPCEGSSCAACGAEVRYCTADADVDVDVDVAVDTLE
ncbi:MAG: hypothetical protein H6720_28955 [Sandaracinus sp.]|nr:hypothetical protein [Sandaracinus sp.]